ncbi:MAG: hypothetical protein RJB38_1100 [Pseudomonadota bacterium]|jgi:hypothetical protein
MKKLFAVGFGLIALAAVVFAKQSHAALYSCYANAFCPQTGRTASCMVYANPYLGQQCTYEYQTGVGVRCTGWDSFGRWVVFEDYCIY